MKKSVPKKLKELVLDAIKRHSWNIGVSYYVGDIFWMEEDKIKEDEKGENLQVHAETIVDRRYLKAIFRIYPVFQKLWEEQGEKYVEETIAHEVAHLVTQHLFDVAVATYRDEGEMKDAWETLTEKVGRLSVELDKQLRKLKKK